MSPKRPRDSAGTTLFAAAGMEQDAPRPLPDRLRPHKLSEVVGQIGHHDAFGRPIQMQFVGHRRRDVGDLRALERRASGENDFVAPGIGRGFQRHRQL